MHDYGTGSQSAQIVNTRTAHGLVSSASTLSTNVEGSDLPHWVPQEAQHYLKHTEQGLTIRAIARKGGCAPSTIMRQVRKIEQKRDDPLIDEALASLRHCEMGDVMPDKSTSNTTSSKTKDMHQMDTDGSFQTTSKVMVPDDAMIEREARRILRRLNETGACLAVAKDMEKAVVVRDLPDGRTTRTAVLDRPIAQALALKDWIIAKERGKITRYTITPAGRNALKKFLAAEESMRAGFAEAPIGFDGQTPVWNVSDVDAQDAKVAAKPSKRVRYNVAESPVTTLSRRRDKSGKMFLDAELVAVAERLREDFELAQMGSNSTQDWEKFVHESALDNEAGEGASSGPDAAGVRVAQALSALGPGLGDVALRCCCFLEGLEQAEKLMGWSARSGKIVLRISLQRLKQHYAQVGYSNLIG